MLEIDDNTIKEIGGFLTKKRCKIMECLYNNEKLSQGELAVAVGTSVASLSNILLRFEMFKHKLLDSSSEGKRRYYYLTDLGKKYYLDIYRKEVLLESENIISRESFLIMQNAKETLNNIIEAYSDKWERIMDDVLISCIDYREARLNEGNKDFKVFLNSVEKVLLCDYENYSVELMKLFASNNILLERFEEFLDKFEAYQPLLQAVQDGFDELQLCCFLETVLGCEQSKAQDYIIKLQWCEQKYNKLVEAIMDVAKHMREKDENQIYDYFNMFMAGNQMLSAILTKEICRYIRNIRKESI